jgi:hypothetical protein
MIQMKNTLKKVLCTALAAVSLSAMVTVPSSLNKPNSDNSFVNVIDANARTIPEKDRTDYDIYLYTNNNYRKVPLTFKLSIKKLNGRSEPDGAIVHTFDIKDSESQSILIDSIRIERYSDTENRIWGHTYGTYSYNDGSGKKQLWICLYRSQYDSKNHKWTVIPQAPCSNPTYKTKLNAKLSSITLSISDYIKNPNNNGKNHELRCRNNNGNQIISFY